MHTLERVLNELARDRFYGSVEIKCESGKPVLLRKTETIKPVEEDHRSTRGNRDERS